MLVDGLQNLVGQSQHVAPLFASDTRLAANTNTFDQVALLIGNGVSFGAVSAKGVRDSAEAFIYSQDPPIMNEDGQPNRIRPGQSISIKMQTQVPTRDTVPGQPKE